MVMLGGRGECVLVSNLCIKENATEHFLVLGISHLRMAVKHPITNQMWGVRLQYAPFVQTLSD